MSSIRDQIVDCIRAVFRGESWMPRPITEALVRGMSAPELTRREQEVLAAMAEGKGNREIGEVLKVSEGTVKVQMTHILGKLQVEGRSDALAAAAVRGLIALDDRAASSGHGASDREPAKVGSPPRVVKGKSLELATSGGL